ncbi:hypothetical protein E7Z59_12910 [Robertkochia marina]|uniref:Uncharacterized protein n=1 Tax=Robertkochia marina TaxID=1227945 RepID=A0A4S3LYL1_9FLAO|nr:hypothetical protein [Robertkochia marina]THD66679.1 hypothetical protein E7Z59_12910 [Robertkochia marina]TRZ45483.1 hypothetical protein D3A96_05720 [Robertkochia marina]
MKTAIQIVLWALSIFFAYQIYNSVMEPIKFDKVKKQRYMATIEKLKSIRDAQEAHRSIHNKYAPNFENLISFIDTAQFVILEKRDSSFMRYNRTYRIDMPVDTIVVDTLGFRAVKDSLFKSRNYKELASVPYAQNDAKFEMKTDILDKNGYQAPVFEAKVPKNVLLYDQPEYLVEQENTMIDVEEVNGSEIKVGSLTDVSTSGNWPPFYDTKKDQ